MSNIMLSLMRQRVKSFADDYVRLTRDLFFDEDEKRLFHNGEYGTYREKLLRKLLRSFLTKQFSMSEGFIINAKNERSKQTDIVIFDTNECPEIEDLELRRFYPIECVYAAGSVKSKLTATTLNVALHDLMETKFLRSSPPPNPRLISPASGVVLETLGLDREWNPQTHENQNIVTFLVCESVDGLSGNDFFKFANGQYEPSIAGIPRRHNMLLSLKDGYTSYFFAKKDEKGEPIRDQNGDFVPEPYPFPNRNEISTGHRWVRPNEYGDHIIQFVHDLARALSETCVYPFDAKSYLPQGEQLYAPMGR